MLVVNASHREAIEHRVVLKWSRYILAACALIGSWLAPGYQETILLPLIIGLVSFWATICHLAEGFSRGYVINPGFSGILFIAIALFSPGYIPILLGIAFGIISYLLILMIISTNPVLREYPDSQLYSIRHPFEKLIPLLYVAPVKLSPVLSAVPAYYCTIGIFSIPCLRITYFDSISIHKYIVTLASSLGSEPGSWKEAIIIFRRAVGILNLLESLQRYEGVDLDGVALAASARLALREIPFPAKMVLSEVVNTFRTLKRDIIKDAFDFQTVPAP